MTTAKTPPGIWAGQLLHACVTAILLALSWAAWKALRQPFPLSFWIAVAFPIVHQKFVWLTWRLELRSSATSKAIGLYGYLSGFFLLFGGRFISLLALAWLDRGSLKLDAIPLAFATTLLALPGVYAMYSVKKYFGMIRAAGVDHFDSRYREMPLVKEGVFRFTDNGMYIYAFLLFWAIAVGFNSSAALVVAAFSHAYIWVHFFATEKPDMEYLYAKEG